MIINFQEEYPEKFEIDDYYCPICDIHIRIGDPIHKCSEKKLRDIERAEKAAETRRQNSFEKEPTTLCDAFDEIEKMHDPEFDEEWS